MGCSASRSANVERNYAPRSRRRNETGNANGNRSLDTSNRVGRFDVENQRDNSIAGFDDRRAVPTSFRRAHSFRENILHDLVRMEMDDGGGVATTNAIPRHREGRDGLVPPFISGGVVERRGRGASVDVNRLSRRRWSRRGFDESHELAPWHTGHENEDGTRSGDDNLDQLRMDLVTLEQLFHTLLGQQLHSGAAGGGMANAPSPSCPPASRHTIEHLPTIKVTDHDFEDECNKECSICFLEHNVNDTVTRLPCGHFFHKECIQEWLRKRCTCPICRWELETDDRIFEIERLERMKNRRIRVKDHELDRLCIGGLQDLAGTKNIKNRAKLIKTIRSLDNVDIITNEERPSSELKGKATTAEHVEAEEEGDALACSEILKGDEGVNSQALCKSSKKEKQE